MNTVDSTSDERTVNNGNVMRQDYRILTQPEKDLMRQVKNMGLMFHDALGILAEETGPKTDSRELDIARVKIEEAVMWAVKHITT